MQGDIFIGKQSGGGLFAVRWNGVVQRAVCNRPFQGRQDIEIVFHGILHAFIRRNDKMRKNAVAPQPAVFGKSADACAGSRKPRDDRPPCTGTQIDGQIETICAQFPEPVKLIGNLLLQRFPLFSNDDDIIRPGTILDDFCGLVPHTDPDSRHRIIIPERFDCRQCQNDITDIAQLNQQNTVKCRWNPRLSHRCQTIPLSFLTAS